MTQKTCKFTVYNRLRPNPLVINKTNCEKLMFDVHIEIQRFGYTFTTPSLWCEQTNQDLVNQNSDNSEAIGVVKLPHEFDDD